MLLENSLNLVFLFISLLLILFGVSRSWQYRKKPLGLYAFVLILGLSFWITTSFVEHIVPVFSVQVNAMKLSYIGLSVVAMAWLAFVIRYTNRNKIITRTVEAVTLLFLSILPITTAVIMWVNEHLMWLNIRWENSVVPPILQPDNGIWFWVNITYMYAIFCAGLIFLAFHFLQLKGIYRKQAGTILAIGGICWGCNILYTLGVEPFKYLDMTPLVFSLTAFFYFIVLGRIDVLDMVPIAHDTIFNNIGDGVVVMDELHKIIDLNSTAEDIFNYKKLNIVGQSYNSVFTEYTGLPEINNEVQETHTMFNDGKGGLRFYEVRLSPIVLQQRSNGYILILHDETERIKLEAELKERVRLEIELFERERANQLLEMKVNERTEQLVEAVAIAKASSQTKAKFLANMSHELRTPLVAIIGFSQMLQEEHLGGLNQKQAEYITDIVNSGKHLLSLINDILDLSRAQEGKMELEKSLVNIENLLYNSRAVFKDSVQTNHVKMTIHVTKDVEDIQIMADERRLKQVMLNLLSNAVKFSPEGGVIKIQANKKDDKVFISVADSGVGISPEEQKYIFTEFYQINNDIRKNTPGSGLGLTICKNIVEKHGGNIWVESEGANKGSRFIFTLPV
jgi:PAS domain S-box-containing protein